MVTRSPGWVSLAGYWAAGLGGGAERWLAARAVRQRKAAMMGSSAKACDARGL